MGKVIIGITVVIFTILAEVVYHKIFDVVYFSGQGCLKELFGCFIVGTICGVLFLKIWYVFAGIVVIMGIICAKKRPENKLLILIITGILTAFITIGGRYMENGDKKESQNTSAQKNIETTTKASQTVSPTSSDNQYIWYDDDGERSEAFVFTVGFDASGFPPYGYKDEAGNYVGFDLDLAQEVCKRRGWEYKAKPVEWDSKVNELNAGTISCIWNGFTITSENKDSYTWSNPYIDISQVFVVKSTSSIKSKADLAGKVVVVQEYSNASKLLEEDYKELKNSFKDLIMVPDYNTAFSYLERNVVDAIALDIGIANCQIEARGVNDYKMLDKAFFKEIILGVGFKLGNVELRDKVQKTLDGMVEDGTLARIAEKWGLTDYIVLGNNDDYINENQENDDRYMKDSYYDDKSDYNVGPDDYDDVLYEKKYLLNNTDSRFIDESELQNFTQEQCSLARNEIYAKHGRKFKTESIQEYFNSCSWYSPLYDPDDFPEDCLNKYEKENVKIIKSYEEKLKNGTAKVLRSFSEEYPDSGTYVELIYDDDDSGTFHFTEYDYYSGYSIDEKWTFKIKENGTGTVYIKGIDSGIYFNIESKPDYYGEYWDSLVMEYSDGTVQELTDSTWYSSHNVG